METESNRSRSVSLARLIHQTDFTPSKGNALQACVATALGLELDEVPNFIAQEGDLYDALRAFLQHRGLGFMKINLEEDGKLPFAPGADSVICLLAGQSPRGSHKHVVIAEIQPGSTVPEPIFDPHPSQAFVSSFIWVGLFVVLNPATQSKSSPKT